MSRPNGHDSLPQIAPRSDRESYDFSGVPDAELRELWAARPVGPDATRDDFIRSTALRTEIFSRLSTPASARAWGKDGR